MSEATRNGLPSAAMIAVAVEQQRTIAERTGRFLTLGTILLLRGDITIEDAAELRGSALFPAEGTAPDAELYGEVALRLDLVRPEHFAEALEIQATDRREKRPYRLIGSILVDRGRLQPKQLTACEKEFRKSLRIRRTDSRRIGAGAGEGPSGPSTLDVRYVREGRGGGVPPDKILTALAAVRKIQETLARRVEVWEYLVVRGIVSLDDHLEILDRNCNAKSPEHGSWMLGGIMVELGYATAKQVADALEARSLLAEQPGKRQQRLGEILVDWGALTQPQVEEALRIQSFRRDVEAASRGAARVARFVTQRVMPGVAFGAAVAAVWLLGWPRLELWRASQTVASNEEALEARLDALGALVRDGREGSLDAASAAAASAHAPAPLRVAALRALVDRGAPRVNEIVRAGLEDADSAVRAAAAWAAGDRRDAGAATLLRARLAEVDGPVKLAAARSLALLGDPGGRDALVAAVDKKRREDVVRLGTRLGRSEEEVGAAFVGALESVSGLRLGPRGERWTAWLALQPIADELCGDRRGPDAVERFAAAYSSEQNLAARFVAARGLAHLGDARGAPLLVRALDPTDWQLRQALREHAGLDAQALGPEIRTLLGFLAGQQFGDDVGAWRAWLGGAAPPLPTPP